MHFLTSLIDDKDPQQSIGCIVTLNYHPFFKERHKEFIHISGESTMIPPLMMVTEILHEKKTSFEEHSGFKISDKTTYQCKCLWYSLKSNKFEEAWLSSKVLKPISECTDSKMSDSPTHGATVVLKTGNIELGKKKATFSQIAKYSEPANTISGLLSFSSPTMIVVGTAKYEIKDSLIDSKTGDKKRWVPNKLLKCKYFNPDSDKLTEVMLPVEVLTLVTQTDPIKIEKLETAISNKKLLTVEFNRFGISRTLIKPIGINYKGAYYFLEVKDLLLNKVEEILINDKADQFREANEIIDSLPKFEETEAGYERIDLNLKYIALLDKSKFWRIKYETLQGVLTERTIHSVQVFSIKRIIPTKRGDREIEIFYIRANCLLRNDEKRFFRVERIKRIEVLDMLIPTTTS